MTTDNTKAMTPMQALAQIADGTGLSKHDMQDLAALAYNTAQREAHLAPREVSVSDEDAHRAWNEYDIAEHNGGDHTACMIAALKSLEHANA